MFIPDPGSDFFSIPDPESATLDENKRQLTVRLLLQYPCYSIVDTYTQGCGSGSGAFLTPGYGMGKKSRPGSGMNNPGHISES